MTNKRTFKRQSKSGTPTTKRLPAIKLKNVYEVLPNQKNPTDNHEASSPPESIIVKTPTPIRKKFRVSKFKLWMMLLFSIFGLLIAITLSFWWYMSVFEQSSNTKAGNLIEDLNDSVGYNLFESQNEFNLLFMSTINSPENQSALLLDSIILINLKPGGTIGMLSIPKDLWIQSLQTKMDALYFYGEDSQASTGPELVRSVVKEITGKQIDRHLVISTDTISSLIDQIGGLNIKISQPLSVPLTNVSASESTASAISESFFSFNQGQYDLDGERALLYSQSESIPESLKNQHYSSSARQQQLFLAILARLSQFDVYSNPNLVGKTYSLWHHEVETDLSNTEAFAIIKFINSRKQLISLSLPTTTSTKDFPLLTVPELSKYDQWVYEPIDPTFKTISEWIIGQGL